MGNLQRKVGRHRVGQLAGLLDLVEGNDHLGRYLLVELDILLELAGHRAGQRLGLLGRAFLFFYGHRVGLEEGFVFLIGQDADPASAFDQDLDGAIGQLQELQHRPHGADFVNIFGSGVVHGGILLGHQKDLLVFLHDAFERLNRLIATDKKRHDHVGEHHDIAKWKNRIKSSFGRINHHRPRLPGTF